MTVPEVAFDHYDPAAHVEGHPIPLEEVVMNTLVIIAGGTENMTAMMTAAIDHLDGNPEDRRRLTLSPDLIPATVDELLRYYPGATTVMRNVVRPTRLGKADLLPGDRVRCRSCPQTLTFPEWTTHRSSGWNGGPTPISPSVPDGIAVSRPHSRTPSLRCSSASLSGACPTIPSTTSE